MDKEYLTVPHRVFELEQAQYERREVRLIALIFLLIVLLFVSNAVWLYSWSQYDYTSEQTVSVDSSDGNATYVGRDGVVSYGEDNGN